MYIDLTGIGILFVICVLVALIKNREYAVLFMILGFCLFFGLIIWIGQQFGGLAAVISIAIFTVLFTIIKDQIDKKQNKQKEQDDNISDKKLTEKVSSARQVDKNAKVFATVHTDSEHKQENKKEYGWQYWE